jgi:hypothetical protein
VATRETRQERRERHFQVTATLLLDQYLRPFYGFLEALEAFQGGAEIETETGWGGYV